MQPTILERFGPLRRSGSSYQAKCPAHPDRVASLSVGIGEDGRVLIYCHAGCPPEAVLEQLGLTWADLAPPQDSKQDRKRLIRDLERKRPAPEAKVIQLPLREVAAYPYHDAQGTLLFEVVRFEPKTFRQRRRVGSSTAWGLGSVSPVLYRLPEVLRAVREREPVWLVEGEKDADRVRALGHTATTAPMGAGKWKDSYTATLAGATVYVVADRDFPGRRHARAVWQDLRAAGCEAGLLEPGAGKDVSDHLDANLSLNDLRTRIAPR